MWGILRHTIGATWRWLKKPANAFSAALTVFGFAGFKDDYQTWVGWFQGIGEMAPGLLRRATEMAVAVLLTPYIQAIAFILAAAILFRKQIRAVLQRLNDEAGVALAEALDQQRFISAQNALHRIMRSQWARTRRNLSERPTSLLDTWKTPIHVDHSKIARNEQFSHWCKKALQVFEQENEEAVKSVDGDKQYDEVTLKEWLAEKYDEDVFDEFGPI